MVGGLHETTAHLLQPGKEWLALVLQCLLVRFVYLKQNSLRYHAILFQVAFQDRVTSCH